MYTHTHTHTHTRAYIYIYIQVGNILKGLTALLIVIRSQIHVTISYQIPKISQFHHDKQSILIRSRVKIFRPDQLFKVTEMKKICCFSTQSPSISTHFSTDTLTSPQLALYIPHSIFHLARLLQVRPETFLTPLRTQSKVNY